MTTIALMLISFAFGAIFGLYSYSKWIDKPEVQNNISNRFRFKFKKNR